MSQLTFDHPIIILHEKTGLKKKARKLICTISVPSAGFLEYHLPLGKGKLFSI